jgi:DNA repair photolyase
MTIKEIETKSMMTKSNLPVSDFSVNTYVGCAHACKYCYASFMKRFTNHCEPPVVVNYFYHEEIIPSSRKEQLRQTRTCC